MPKGLYAGAGAARARIRDRALCAAACVCLCLPASAADTWQTPDATIRFTLNIKRRPSHKQAGCIVRLPDGGILPKPAPGFTVVDKAGKTLKHGCLWHDPDHSLLLVFEPPAEGNSAFVYAQRAASLNAWEPSSGLTPSVVAYIKPKGENLDDAHKLAKSLPAAKGLQIEFLPTLALGALPQGLPGPFSDYVLAYVATKDPGKTWMAPEALADASLEIRVDGRKLKPKKEFPQRSGATGDWCDLTAEPHRVEIFGHRPTDQARIMVSWKPPHAQASELGGKNPVYEGMAMWAARQIREDECVHSGAATVSDARFRDGSPVPIFSATPKGYLWLDDQPVILYGLAADAGPNPKSARYAWRFDNAAELSGPTEVTWLFESARDCRVALTVSDADKRNSAACSFQSFCSGRLHNNVNSPEDADAYRAAFLNMLKATPAEKDPTGGWSRTLWDLFMRLVDPVRAKPLLTQLFSGRWDLTGKRLADRDRWHVEDMFLGMISASDPQQAMKWIAQFENRERNDERKRVLALHRADILIYYLDDMASAEKIVQPLASSLSPARVRAQIRMGDIAFLTGKHNDAIRIYGSVQNRVRHTQPGSTPPEPEEDSASAKRSDARSTIQKPHSLTAKAAASTQARKETDKDWRVGTVRDTAVSETARSLIRQRFYVEARQALDEWEMEFPMSKISGDFIVVEAMLCMELGDFKRPLLPLTQYCRSADVTNDLPEAMRLALTCKMKLGESGAKLEEFAVEIKKKFQYHPLNDEVDRIMEKIRAQRKPDAVQESKQ